MKRTLGWTAPKVRHVDTTDPWTWLIITAHTQFRLARPFAAPGNDRPGPAPTQAGH